MKFLNKVPGFRSGKKLNKIVACIYYIPMLFSLIAVFGELDLMLMVMSTFLYPFIVFGFVDVVKNHQKIKSKYFVRKVVVPFAIMILFSSTSLGMYDDSTINDLSNGDNVVESDNVVSSAEDTDVETEVSPEETSNEVVITESEIHFINTGNSDSILIKNGDKAALIDGGDNDDESKVVSYIKNQGINELEYVFATHPHADHIGGLDAVVNDITVKNIYVSNGDADTKTYRDFINSMANKGLSPSVPLLNSEFTLGNSTFKVISVANTEDPNNNSLVLLYTNGNDKVLFMGDAESDIESKINPGDIDLLKVGHHGSSSSTTKSFINKISPEYGVILASKDNQYGHPHAETMSTLENAGVKIHRSDECGNIVFKSSGNGLTTECSEGSYSPGSKSKSNSTTSDNNSSSQSSTDSSNSKGESSTSVSGGTSSSNTGTSSNNNSNSSSNNVAVVPTPQPEPTPDPEPTPQPSTDGRVVYANGGTSTSNKYHSSPTAHNMEGAIKMSEDEAKSQGYVACKRCY